MKPVHKNKMPLRSVIAAALLLQEERNYVHLSR